MSDLSRLLGDVYGPGPASPAEETATDDEPEAAEGQATTLSGALPEWADESVLDEAFANWVPGPPSDAPVAERGMLADLAAGPPAGDAPTRPVEARTTTLAEAVPAAPDFIFPQTDNEPATTQDEAPGRWQRADDDLLPVRGRARGLGRRRR